MVYFLKSKGNDEDSSYSLNISENREGCEPVSVKGSVKITSELRTENFKVSLAGVPPLREAILNRCSVLLTGYMTGKEIWCV